MTTAFAEMLTALAVGVLELLLHASCGVLLPFRYGFSEGFRRQKRAAWKGSRLGFFMDVVSSLVGVAGVVVLIRFLW